MNVNLCALLLNPKYAYPFGEFAIGSLNMILLLILFYSGTVVPMLLAVMTVVPIEKLAVLFHDTYGQSLPNVLVSLQVSQQIIACTFDLLVY